MQNIQLFLNDSPIDLSSDEPIALTFQINNLAEVKNQQGNTSNQFKIPNTANNRAVLGFPDDIRFTNDIPYTQLTARIIQNGVEVVPDGIAEINGADENSITITVLSGNVDFFDAIDAPIYDMGDSSTDIGKKQLFAPYNSVYSLQSVIDSQTNTEGLIWPVIDYGSIDPNEPQNIDIRQQRPGFFLKTAIELIVKSTGYKANGSLLQHPLYNRLIVQFANDNFEHGTDYVNFYVGNSLVVSNNTVQTYRNGQDGADQGLVFQQINSGNTANYYFPTSAYVARANIDVTISFEYNFTYYSGDNQGNLKFTIELYDPGTGERVELAANPYFSDTYDPNIGAWVKPYKNQKLSYDIELAAGQSIDIWYHIPQNTKKYTTFELPAGALFKVTEKKSNVLLGQPIQAERIFPDVNQKDLLKDTLQRFGIICQTDNTQKTVTFATLSDIVANIPIAKDWTGMCINQGKNISFQLGNYAQVNTLKYKQDDAITAGFADDVINVKNKTLADSLNLFESIFAPSLNVPFVTGSIAQIKKITDYTESLDFDIGTMPRLLIDQKLNLLTNNKTVNFTDGTTTKQVNSVISVPYFHKPDGEYTLCWCDKDGQTGLRRLNYKELERILTQAKKVVRFFILNERDIQELDLLIPVYLEQDNAYYYINRVDAWRRGVATKVELIKLGEI